ncbi:MAG: LLM class flavin-dependent oxidoreductase, partial [Candidatus Limnocylindrales bacterium]
MTEPQQGLSYDEILAVAKAAEANGFSGFFRSDHYASFPGDPGLPTTDCWATLAGLARETTGIQLGALVSPVTFRIPGAFAKMVMTVDEMSGGRVEVGVGAGWNDVEHEQLGIAFPDVPARVDMLEEELEILTGLWSGAEGWAFDGAHWKVRGGSMRPNVRPEALRTDGRERPNLIVGGTGKPRSLRLGARFADEYNISSSSAERCAEVRTQLAAECEAIGRDPST